MPIRSAEESDTIAPHMSVWMFAILDRRVGKRTLEKMADSIDSEPMWLQEVYEFRTKEEKGNK
ncbi:hypothetical protein D6856_02870 [Butyrivibrio sp. XB500-5]|nr:hypothetical protein [Butyrivibrio sp. XB500-5]RKM63079.1 hypothetical protein D6856_02870 [Butyrivibrio sp. XB500-5]